MTFTLNLVQPEYIKNTGEAAGALIVIHKQDMMPFPGDQAILAPPGSLVTIGIKQVIWFLTLNMRSHDFKKA